jgi:nitroimidazol reductase NimA-like FMN-containing flavoprotein (pyridoxamine 5'-phosphate oxidase superfamily)
MTSYRRANKQYIAMNEEEVWAYLESMNRIVVALVQADGYPHASPVWFVIIDRKIYFTGASYKVKFKLAESAKICCVCDDGESYIQFRGVMVWGESSLVKDPGLSRAATALFENKYARLRYEPTRVPAEWVKERVAESWTWVEVRPERISSWDNTKLLTLPESIRDP